LHGALLDLGHTGGDADDDARTREQRDAVVHLVDEVLEHVLGDVEVADDAVLQRPDRDDVLRRAAEHPLGLGTDREDRAGLQVLRDDGRLADHDAATADVHERVRRAEVDADITGEQSPEGFEQAGAPFPETRVGRCEDRARIARISRAERSVPR